MTDLGLWGLLTALSLVFVVIFASLAAVHVTRMRNRGPTPMSEEVGSIFGVMRKLRKREPLSSEERDLAEHVIADRRSLMAYSIPATLFALGCFYVFGSLEHLHGARPSERTFLGLIPMFTSMNLIMRLLRGAKLKGRLRSAS